MLPTGDIKLFWRSEHISDKPYLLRYLNLSPPLDYTLVERLRKDRVITEILGNNIESLIMKSMEEYELRLA